MSKKPSNATVPLKGQCHKIFCLWFFYESVSPKPLSIPLGPFQIFFENSRRYSQLKVDHRLVANLPPVSTTPAAKLLPVSTTPVAN